MRTGGVEVCWTEWRGCTQAATYNSWSNTAHTSHVPLLHGSWCAPRYKMCGGMFEIVKEGSRMLQIAPTWSRLFGGKTFRDPKPPNPNIIICSAMYAPHQFWRMQIEKSAVFFQMLMKLEFRQCFLDLHERRIIPITLFYTNISTVFELVLISRG